MSQYSPSSRSEIIQGGVHKDERGKVIFVNDFDLTAVKRFYLIQHDNTDLIRAWQGHQIERKWFFCVRGGFEIKCAAIKNWTAPAKDVEFKQHMLTEQNPQVLCIPAGFINGFRATQENSVLMVYSDLDTAASKADDFRFHKDYWGKW